MAAIAEMMDFGIANAGGAPTFVLFDSVNPFAALTPPTIYEVPSGQGKYYFLWDWATAPVGVQTVTYKATLNGVEYGNTFSGTNPPGTVSVSSASSSLVGYDTAKNIINRVILQTRIGTGTLSTMSDPFASTDPNALQLIELLNTLGAELNNFHDWSQLVREATILTAGAATSYALPADFQQMFNQSGWNRSMRLPLVGPLSSQEAQFLKARLGNVIINVAFRLQGNLMTFPIAPADNQTIVFEYLSDYWVQTAASATGPDALKVTQATDTVLYDPELMVAGLKLAWLENAGFDTAAAETRYHSRLAYCISKNVGSRILSMGGSGLSADRFLDQNNVPPTNFG